VGLWWEGFVELVSCESGVENEGMMDGDCRDNENDEVTCVK